VLDKGNAVVGRLIVRSQRRAAEPALTWTTLGGLSTGIGSLFLTALLVAVSPRLL